MIFFSSSLTLCLSLPTLPLLLSLLVLLLSLLSLLVLSLLLWLLWLVVFVVEVTLSKRSGLNWLTSSPHSDGKCDIAYTFTKTQACKEGNKMRERGEMIREQRREEKSAEWERREGGEHYPFWKEVPIDHSIFSTYVRDGEGSYWVAPEGLPLHVR